MGKGGITDYQTGAVLALTGGAAAARAWWNTRSAARGSQGRGALRQAFTATTRRGNRRGRVQRATYHGGRVGVGRGRKRRRGGGRGRRRKGVGGKGRFLSGNQAALKPGKWVLKYKVNSLFAYSPRRTVQELSENHEYYIPRLYFNAFAAHYPLAAWTGCIAVPVSSVGAWKSQPAGWDVLAQRYLKYFCYGSALKFAIFNPSATDTEVLTVGNDNAASAWYRIYDQTSDATDWPLPSDPDPPSDNAGRWAAPVARTSKVSFFKSRRTARSTEFGEGANRNDIESLMFESDTLIEDLISRSDMTNEELAFSRMSAYSQQMLIPPRKQRQLAGVKTLDLTGTQETRMFGSMSVTSKFLPRHKIKVYKKMRRALSSTATGNLVGATGVGPWRLTTDQNMIGNDMQPAESDRNYGVYVIQLDDLAQVASAEWNLIEIAVDISYRCKFWGDKNKPIDQHRRFEMGSDQGENFGTEQKVNNDFLHNKNFTTTSTGQDAHTYVSSVYRTFDTAWTPSQFVSIEDWIESY